MTTEINQETAATPLRICCYGSSSSRTPEKYTNAAYDLGHLLARRGHTCVNGAGSTGCMAAMNRGANDGDGHIVGVIHEKFVVDGSDWFEGAHSVFRDGRNEIVVASGNDLQERKRLLVEGADALVVLPGGPGTWDEVKCRYYYYIVLDMKVTNMLKSSSVFFTFSCGRWHVLGTSVFIQCQSCA